jgi:hypothetical protein
MPSVMVAGALGVFAYASGNAIFANYLLIPHVAGVGVDAHLLFDPRWCWSGFLLVQYLPSASIHG